MKIERVRVTPVETSFWGDFASRQNNLRLVHPMAMYPQYRHPVSSWFPDRKNLRSRDRDRRRSRGHWLE